MVSFRRRVRIAGGRFWCAACNSVNRTCSTSTLLFWSMIWWLVLPYINMSMTPPFWIFVFYFSISEWHRFPYQVSAFLDYPKFHENNITLKTKEMLLGPLSKLSIPPLVINYNSIERVCGFKLIGVYISNDLFGIHPSSGQFWILCACLAPRLEEISDKSDWGDPEASYSHYLSSHNAHAIGLLGGVAVCWASVSLS